MTQVVALGRRYELGMTMAVESTCEVERTARLPVVLCGWMLGPHGCHRLRSRERMRRLIAMLRQVLAADPKAKRGCSDH